MYVRLADDKKMSTMKRPDSPCSPQLWLVYFEVAFFLLTSFFLQNYISFFLKHHILIESLAQEVHKATVTNKANKAKTGAGQLTKQGAENCKTKQQPKPNCCRN